MHPPSSFPEIRVVEASAGSGKTYALAVRYLQLLLGGKARPEDVRGILAITFTNAAAREMKERILEFLKKLALDAFNDGEEKGAIVSSLSTKGATAGKRARALLDYLVRNYSYFQVQTIDSFINLLLSGCASELHLSAGFGIQKDPGDCLAYGLDECVESAGLDARVKALFEKFLHQYIHVENRSSWFPKGDVFATVKELYGRSNIYGLDFEKSGLASEDILALRKSIRALMAEVLDDFPEGANKAFRNSLERLLARNRSGADLAALGDFFLREEFPMNKGRAVPERIGALWSRMRAGLGDLARDEARAAFDCYVDIFNEVLSHFRRAARRKDLVFLGELNRLAAELFGEELVGVSEIYFRLACQFSHFMIDEFQDTSALQWHNLEEMVREALARGGSLYYVGDKKQAIYRFRGGEVELFDRAPHRFTNAPVHPSRLTVNYRSGEWIVEFNNEVFSGGNLERFLDGLQPEDGADRKSLSPHDREAVLAVYRHATQQCKDGASKGYVRVEPVDGSDFRGRESAIRGKLVGLVRELSERFRPEDIALLARDNDDVELITAWLIAENVRTASERTLSIRNNPHVKSVISFLKFLNSPIDDLSFASFICGEIFTAEARVDPAEIREFLFAMRRRQGAGPAPYLYRDFRARYPKIWEEYIEEFFKTVGMVPLYELVVNVIGRLKAPKRFPESAAFFMRLLQLVKEQEEEHPDIAGFLDYFERDAGEELFVGSLPVGAVRVMTVHKAKGLQFPVVIVPFLEFDPRVASAGRGAAPFTVRRQDGRLLLMRLDRKYARFSDEVRDAYRDEYRKAIIDGLNVIYVACTRAMEEMYLFVPCGEGRSENAARHLIPPGSQEMGKPGRAGGRGSVDRPLSRELTTGNYADWRGFLREEYADTTLIKRRAEALKGDTLHRILSLVGNLHGRDAGVALSQAVEEASLGAPPGAQLAEAARAVGAIIESPLLKPFFRVEDGEVYMEKEMADSTGRMGRVDRLIVKEKGVWVVDFKSSGAARASHKEQMGWYMQMVRELYPRRTVRGFLIFMDEVRVEEV
jgi:ATP-dependent exoDNAse (exonuclease V) beta subunit